MYTCHIDNASKEFLRETNNIISNNGDRHDKPLFTHINSLAKKLVGIGVKIKVLTPMAIKTLPEKKRGLELSVNFFFHLKNIRV